MKTSWNAVRMFLILLVLGSNIGCDQISKNIARERLAYYDQISLLNGHLTLMKVENKGAFLSLGTSLPQPLKFILLGILPLTALALALVYVVTKRRMSAIRVVGMCFLIGGGIGNIADRMIYGSVTDFLHLTFGALQTGIFNMADVSIMTGILLVLLDSWYNRLVSTYKSY
ncbi:MAG: signal peptidase II [Chryseolinea sp.]